MYSNYIHPFRDLQKDAMWLWSEQHSQAYQQLKENFKKAVSLSHICNTKRVSPSVDKDNCANIAGRQQNPRHLAACTRVLVANAVFFLPVEVLKREASRRRTHITPDEEFYRRR